MALRSPLTLQPYDYIGDSTGRPLNKGQIYIGVAGQDPEFYQIPVFLDAEMTKPIDQPIRTNDGYIDFGGSITDLYASGEIYSVKVLDKEGRKVIYKPDMTRKNLMSDALNELTQAVDETMSIARESIETIQYYAEYIENVAEGKDGADGESASIDSLTVTTGAAGTAASVVTGGTPTARTFALTIPQGDKGDKGLDGSFTQKSYTTEALMIADKANIPANTSVSVTNDTDSTKNGMYAYNGTVFTKSAYDPVTLAATDATTKANNAKTQAIAAAATDATTKDGAVKAEVDTKIEAVNDIDMLLNIKDSAGKTVVHIDRKGAVRVPHIDGTLQDAVNSTNTLISKDNDSSIAQRVKSSDGKDLLIIDSRGGIHATGVKGTIQNALAKITDNTNEFTELTTTSERSVGKAVYAVIPNNKTATGYQWKKDGVIISGETKRFYVLKTTDINSLITVSVRELRDDNTVRQISQTSIGGVEIGASGQAGTLYDGYVLSSGDDFNELDIIAPHKPLGRWFTTRTYLAGARGSDTLLGSLYDTDPYHLGFNDSNRGVPVGYNNMSLKDSVLTLNARVATADEKKHFQGTGRNEVASMISSVGAFSMYAGASDGGENILEFRVRHTHKDENPNGWHPTLWTQSSLPSVTFNSNEWDISEGTSKNSYVNYNLWGADGTRTSGSTHGALYIFDGEWHTITAIFSHTKFQLYIDGVFDKEVLFDTNSLNEPAYALVTNHIYKGTFVNDSYDKAKWDLMVQGATQEVDYIRLWRRASKSHIKPLVAIKPINISYGATGTLTLPSKMDLWGRTDVLEHVQTVMTEENEPAGSHNASYNALPSFIAYSDITRTATINTANQKSGRLNFVIYGYLQDGSTSEPARTYANVAPRINVDNVNMTINTNYDLYAVCDCGVLVTDGIKRTKVINVSGLPLNASYNDNTGLIYSNDAASGTYALSVQCVNSVGQSTTKSINLIIA